MFRKILSITTAFALALAPTHRSQADQPRIPIGHVWDGMMSCDEGFRMLRIISIPTPHPLYVAVYGPRFNDRTTSGMAVVSPYPDSSGKTRLVVDRVLVRGGSAPTALAPVWLAPDGSLKGTTQGISGCYNFQAIDLDPQDARAELQDATTNTENYLKGYAAYLTQTNKGAPTAGDWARLAFAGVAIAAMIGVSAGSIPSAGAGDLGIRKGDGDFKGPSNPEKPSRSPSVGGNVHGHGDSDVHGNAWGG